MYCNWLPAYCIEFEALRKDSSSQPRRIKSPCFFSQLLFLAFIHTHVMTASRFACMTSVIYETIMHRHTRIYIIRPLWATSPNTLRSCQGCHIYIRPSQIQIHTSNSIHFGTILIHYASQKERSNNTPLSLVLLLLLLLLAAAVPAALPASASVRFFGHAAPCCSCCCCGCCCSLGLNPVSSPRPPHLKTRLFGGTSSCTHDHGTW